MISSEFLFILAQTVLHPQNNTSGIFYQSHKALLCERKYYTYGTNIVYIMVQYIYSCIVN